MEVPRERRCCSFEVHLVYCWPFWFNLYHQRALLNYWQPNLFSLGHGHWVNKFLLLFLSFHSILFFPFIFCFSFAYPDGPTQIKHEMTGPGISRPLKKPPKATGWRATDQMECFCSPFKTGLTSIHLLGPRSGSNFSMKTSQNTAPSGFSVSLLPAIITQVTINFDYVCNFCHSGYGRHTQSNVTSLPLDT